MPTGKIRVFVIDDSALMRGVLAGIFADDSEIEVVGSAADPIAAWRAIKATRPDVLTLDVEMPRMDGLTFLERLMAAHPMPVVMVSKPRIDVRAGTVALASEIIAKVKAAARARVARVAPRPDVSHRIIAVGASTGGTEALRAMLGAMPAASPGIVVVQHMSEQFTKAFAARLNDVCQIEVREAVGGERILPGLALIAPGSHHLRVRRNGAEYRAELSDDPPVNQHRPSVDVLFDSCAKAAAHNAIGVILTGMGSDGASGMRTMHDAGAQTIAQNEATCVVYGMPREAVLAGGVDLELPLGEIAGATLRFATTAPLRPRLAKVAI